MICKPCEKRITMQAFSDGECQECGKHIHYHVTPCAKVCKECSEEHELCEVCGHKWTKVFLVWILDFMAEKELYAVRSSMELANDAETEFWQKQETLKWRYEHKYGVKYDTDLSNYGDEEVVDRMILFRAKYPLLTFTKVVIEETYFK